jgi:hypothetical protein
MICDFAWRIFRWPAADGYFAKGLAAETCGKDHIVSPPSDLLAGEKTARPARSACMHRREVESTIGHPQFKRIVGRSFTAMLKSRLEKIYALQKTRRRSDVRKLIAEFVWTKSKKSADFMGCRRGQLWGDKTMG